MRRQEILDGVNQVLSALTQSEIRDSLQAKLRGGEDAKEQIEVNAKLLDSLRLYNMYAQTFNPAAKEVSRILRLNSLENARLWVGLTATRQATAFKLFQDVTFAIEQLPKIIKLLKQELIRRIEESEDDVTSKYKGMRVLTINVFEAINVFSSPARLANVLESIDLFYTACALLNGESPSTLSVIACDSGSDKSFDFLGIAKLMDCVERLIGTIFERVFFFREHQFEERLDLVTKALPIIQQINKMEEHKELAPEMAEVLRRNIFDGTNKFIQSGATIPKIEDKSQYDARSLLSPVQKLLVAAPDESTEDVSSEHPNKKSAITADDQRPEEDRGSERLTLENLSDEEQDQLFRLLQKSRSAPSKVQETNGEGDSEIEGGE